MTTTMQPPSVLLIGAPGSGKTDSLATLNEAGLEVFVIVTEPGGVESLLDSCARRKLPIDKLHWTSALPAVMPISAIEQMTQTVATQGFADIQNIKSGVGKDVTRQPAMKFLTAMKDFKCERTGELFGEYSKWGPDRALVVDSLSGLSQMAMALTVGYKPAIHQGEWGIAMNYVEQVLMKLTADRNCFFVMTAHVEKETNEISGASQIMASTLGRKLAPKIPRFFSEAVYAKRTVVNNVPKFLWSTADTQAELKNRALAVSADLPPDFGPVVDAYRRRLAMVSSTGPAAKPAA